MTKVTDIPAGTVEPLWLRITGETVDGSQVSYIEAEGQSGAEIRILFSPSSPGRRVNWETGTWYKVDNLIHAPDISQQDLTCPDCGTALRAVGDAVQEAISLIRGHEGWPRFVGTSGFEATQIGASEWLAPLDEREVKPIQWECPDCDTGMAPRESGTDRGAADRRQSLADRVRSVLDGGSTVDSDNTTDPLSHSFGGESFRDKILSGGHPTADEVTLSAVLSAYDFGPTVPDSTILDSLAPTIEGAVSTDPVTETAERFCDFRVNARSFDWSRYRPPLDLVVAIDISGSMAAPFKMAAEGTDPAPSKLAAVRESLAAVLQRLNPTDQVGIVLFDTDAMVAKPLQPVSETAHEELQTQLSALHPSGNTAPMAGFRRAGELFDDGTADCSETERRIILVSDTMPTVNSSSPQRYIECSQSYQQRGLHTTFVGVDFPQAGGPREFCRVSGANTAVAPEPEALDRLFGRHIDSLLFPVAFGLRIQPDTATEVMDVAAPSDPASFGGVFSRKTVFPPGPTAQSLNGVLFQLSDATDQSDFQVSWTDREGDSQQATLSVTYDRHSGDWFDSDTVRVKIALYRYLRALQAWCRGGAVTTDSTTVTSTVNMDDLTTQLSHLKEYLSQVRVATGNERLETDIAVLAAILND